MRVLLQRTEFRSFPSAQKIRHQRLCIYPRSHTRLWDSCMSAFWNRQSRVSGNIFFLCYLQSLCIWGRWNSTMGLLDHASIPFCQHSVTNGNLIDSTVPWGQNTVIRMFLRLPYLFWIGASVQQAIFSADQTFLVPKGQILHFEIAVDQTDTLDSPQNIGLIQAILPWTDENMGLLPFSSAESRFQQESAGMYPSWVLKF